ncbi:MAG: hypothetical protein NTW21_10665 [Verrucomicrobia bacterium]|nr:hypothetical protein [Verrucomicrobiota bacterium]
MRLVFLNQYYPPDAAPTGVMLEGLVQGLAKDGHEVTVLCAPGGYAGAVGRGGIPPRRASPRRDVANGARGEEEDKEVICDCEGRADPPRSAELPSTAQDSNDHAMAARPQGESGRGEAATPYQHPRIIRIGATTFGRGSFTGKLLDYASYYLGVSWKLLAMRPAPERIVAMTTPPYLSVLARLISKLRGADHAHWVMDLYPEVMAAHGMLNERGLPYRLLAGLARWGFGGRRCAVVLTLGPDMAERVERLRRSEVGGQKTPEGSEGVWTGAHATCSAGVSEWAGGRINSEVGEQERSRIEDQGLTMVDEEADERCPCASSSIHHPPSTSLDPQATEPVIGEEPAGRDRRARPFVASGARCDRGDDMEKRVQWVPLWGGGVERMSNANIERRTEVDCEGRTERPRSAELSPAGRAANDQALTSRPQGESGPNETAWPYLHSTQAPRTTERDPRSTDPALALRRQRGWGDHDLVVMYSGNMGLGHRFGEILAAAGRAERPRSADLSPTGQDVNDPAISSHPQGESGRGEAATPYPSHAAAVQRLRIVFFGGGTRRDEVATFAREYPECGVELYDYAPADDLAAHLQSADVHLASLDPAWTGTMVPSKVQGIFGAGRPVIFIGSADSSIGRWVLESGGGWVVAAGDVAGLLAALAAARDPALRATRGRAAKTFAEEHFDRHTNIARVAAILTGKRGGRENKLNG